MCAVMLLCLQLSAAFLKGWTTFYFMFPNLFSLIYYECLCIKKMEIKEEEKLCTNSMESERGNSDEQDLRSFLSCWLFFFINLIMRLARRKNLDKELILYHKSSVCAKRECERGTEIWTAFKCYCDCYY